MKKILLLLLCLISIQISCFSAPNFTQKDPITVKIESNYNQLNQIYSNYKIQSVKMSEAQKEWAFKEVYKKYIQSFLNFENFYIENELYISKEQANKYNFEFKNKGVIFGQIEDGIYPKISYMPLLNSSDIPLNWREWLNLQQKYKDIRNKHCEKYGCEGESLGMGEIEQAIIDLEKIENKSSAIASIKTEDLDYISDTSNRFINTYLLGNELYPHFDYSTGDIYPLHKKSYEHFIETYKESKYNGLVKEYYEKLKQDNFKYNENTREWIINKISGI